MIDQQILAAQRLSRDEIHQLQSQRLRALVRHVYDNVPFYRRKMDKRGVKPQDIRTAEDIDLLQKENSALCNEVIDLEQELKALREAHEKCQRRQRQKEQENRA